MRSRYKDNSLSTKQPQFEWKVSEDERDWQWQSTASFGNYSATVLQRRTYLQWVWHFGLPILLLAILSAGTYGFLYRGQMGVEEVERELEAVVAAEMWLPAPIVLPLQPNQTREWQKQLAREWETLRALASPSKVFPHVEVVELGNDWALVQVEIQLAGSSTAYRQTRVYQETEQGWARTAPSPAYWGQSLQLESRYFSFHYYAQDAAAVAASAERHDRLYLKAYQHFFPGLPDDKKLVVLVNPGMSLQELIPKIVPRHALIVLSPAATLAPIEVARGDLLTKSLLLVLQDYMSDQASLRRELIIAARQAHAHDQQEPW